MYTQAHVSQPPKHTHTHVAFCECNWENIHKALKLILRLILQFCIKIKVMPSQLKADLIIKSPPVI